MRRRALAPALVLAAAVAAVAAAYAWFARPDEVAPEAEPGETTAAIPASRSAEPPRRAPSLAGRGRRVILPVPSPPRREGGGVVAPPAPAPPAPPEPPAPLGPNDPGRVRVRLRTPDGSALPTMARVARGALATGLEWWGSVWVRDGALVVEGVGDGEQQIVADVGAWAPVVISVRAPRGVETDVGEVLLSRGVALSGTVVDDEGRPVAQALVSAAGERFSTRTDDRGEFALERLPEGPVDVEVEAEGHVDAEIEVEAGRDRSVRIPLERYARLGGTVLLADGRPAGLVRLTLVDVGAPPREALEPFPFDTAEDGTFLLDAVPGRYRIHADHHDLGEWLCSPGLEQHLLLRLPSDR